MDRGAAFRPVNADVNDRRCERRSGERQSAKARWTNHTRPIAHTPAAIAPVAESPASGARRRSRASSGKTARMIAELHGLDADVEDEQRRQQRPRPGLVDPERRGEPEPVHQAEAEDHREPRPARAVEAEVPVPGRLEVGGVRSAPPDPPQVQAGDHRDRERDDRLDDRRGHVHQAERGQDEGHRVGEREASSPPARSRAAGATRRSAPAGTGCGRSRCSRCSAPRRKNSQNRSSSDCCVENDGCFASRLALPDCRSRSYVTIVLVPRT